jgi:hypothetical protein
MSRKEIIAFGVDLNKLPPREDSLAIVLVEEPLPLTVIPLKQVATVLPRRTYEQAYYAKVCQTTLPPPSDHLLLKDGLKGPKIAVPKDVKLLPPRSNEKLVGVKSNKIGEVTYVTQLPLPECLLMVFELHQVKSTLFRQGNAQKTCCTIRTRREASKNDHYNVHISPTAEHS